MKNYTDDEQSSVLERLQMPPALERIKQRVGPRKKQVSYLDGHYVIQAANEIFGADNWGYELIAPPQCIETEKGQIWMSIVTVHVRGMLSKTDVGIGIPVNDDVNSIRVAILSSTTQALKRALRSYGPALGLALYDEDFIEGIRGRLHSDRRSESRARPPRTSMDGEETALPKNGAGGTSSFPPREMWDAATVKRALHVKERQLHDVAKATASQASIISNGFRDIVLDIAPEEDFSEVMNDVLERLWGTGLSGMNRGQCEATRRWLVGERPNPVTEEWEVCPPAQREVRLLLASKRST